MKKYEVEQKYHVEDHAAVQLRLDGLGAEQRGDIEQVDTYYAHPCRDFAETDEALRIRRIGSENRVTYKGPRKQAEVKTRQEIEFPFGAGNESALQMQSLLEALGFRQVAQVRKRRRVVDLSWMGETVECALDDVDGVGQFVELELTTDEAGLADAQSRIQALAEELELRQVESSSYLALLLRSQSPGGGV